LYDLQKAILAPFASIQINTRWGGWNMLRRLRVVMALAVCTVAALAWAGHRSYGGIQKSYELLSAAEDGPRMFAEGAISTPDDEAGGAFSPDGTEFYFTKLNPTTTFPRISLLCVSRLQNGQWSTPGILPFSGRNLDFPARLSPDGKTLYFSSSRPVPGSDAHAFSIWKVAKTATGWGNPEALPEPVNLRDGHSSWGPSITRDGTIYFASDRDPPGRSQIYRAKMSGGKYEVPGKLGPEINSAFNDSEPFVSADESLLFFVSSGEDVPPFRHRPDTLYTGGFPYARGDIYVSRRVNGQWSKAEHLEHGVNSVADEGPPALTPDGKFLIFASYRSPFTVPVAKRLNMAELEKNLHATLNGEGNIYTIPLKALGIDAPR
jgi:Tol biopolymer transport system component